MRKCLPSEYDNEVEPVPGISEISVTVHYKTKCQGFKYKF